MQTQRHRAKRLLVLTGSMVALLAISVSIGAFLVVQHRHQQATDYVVAQACRQPSDAAGRSYLHRHASAAGANYIDSLTAMYRRCPRTPGNRRRSITPTTSPSPTASPSGTRPPSDPNSSRDREAGEDADGGDD